MDMPCIWQWHRLFALKVKQHIWYNTIGCLLEIKTLVIVSSSVFAFAPTISFGGELWLMAVVAWATPVASVVLFGDCVSKQKMPLFFLFSSLSFGLFIYNSGDRLEHLRLYLDSGKPCSICKLETLSVSSSPTVLSLSNCNFRWTAEKKTLLSVLFLQRSNKLEPTTRPSSVTTIRAVLLHKHQRNPLFPIIDSPRRRWQRNLRPVPFLLRRQQNEGRWYSAPLRSVSTAAPSLVLCEFLVPAATGSNNFLFWFGRSGDGGAQRPLQWLCTT